MKNKAFKYIYLTLKTTIRDKTIKKHYFQTHFLDNNMAISSDSFGCHCVKGCIIHVESQDFR